MQNAQRETRNSELNTQYETVVGLEVHVQLATESKAFCADSTRFGGAPNTHTSVISLAHPGTLPRANRRQIELAIRLGLALGCRINQKSAFDRKNYFYADSPKGYQITQDREPICIGGSLDISVFDTKNQKLNTKHIRIHHIHMEEDAGKSIHDQDPSVTFIDLNRAGTPLLEIVTEPDLRSGEEVEAFMYAMRHLVRWLGVSDGNMEEGSMRCDVNISIRAVGATKFGTRCEVKNVNSMRFARRAIEFETRRQIELVESGGSVSQQTLNFDPATGITTPLRDKENAHDYRYFPDPDLPPVVVSDAFLETMRSEMATLPQAARTELTDAYGLSAYDAQLLTDEFDTFCLFKNMISAQADKPQPKSVANLIINKILPTAHDLKIELLHFPLTINDLCAFLHLIDSGKISNSAAYQTLFPALLASNTEGVETVAERLNLFQTADSSELENWVAEVILKNPDKVAEYRKGKKGLLGFFMGEVKRLSQGKAEPKATNALVLRALEK